MNKYSLHVKDEQGNLHLLKNRFATGTNTYTNNCTNSHMGYVGPTTHMWVCGSHISYVRECILLIQVLVSLSFLKR